MADNENTPLGNFLGFVGFFAGLAIGLNSSDDNIVVGLILGFILAGLGALLGNLIWQILIIVIAVIIAVVSFNVRQEVTKVAVDVIRDQVRQDKQSNQTYYYVSCLSNETQYDIYYQYRWDSESTWTDKKLKSNWNYWRGNTVDQKFHIKFDKSFTEGYQSKEYYLLRKYTSNGCDGGMKYEFYLSNGEIDVRRVN